jgi:DNA-binding transcriptional MerR regulator
VRISELARRGGVPVGTVKYYLREGLLPPGTRTSPTQAQYGEHHVERLSLIRVLVGTGKLSVAAARRALAAIDDPPPSVHELIGTAHAALGPGQQVEPAQRERARELVDRWGWRIGDGAVALDQLAAAVDALETAGIHGLDDTLDRYAGVAAELAAGDVAGVPTDTPASAVRFVVLATVLLEPLLLALRRLAQEDASARRWGAGER